jgi:glutamyl-tRNA synthetase
VSVRVRFAPSPTGSLHLGSALVAVLNALLVRKHGGALLLRIDDTDVGRSLPQLVRSILDDLEWLGIAVDEGPIRQSERFDRYREAAAGLAGAYERDGALYLRAPEPVVEFEDAARGPVRAAVDDFVLLRADGRATYAWATAVDDAELGITHVLRGEDHLSNTGTQILALRALGVPLPTFAHCALLLAPEGKLSKREGAASIAGLRDQGYPAEAVLNYLGLLAIGGEGDVLSLDQLAARFELRRLPRGTLRADPARLRSLATRQLARLAATELTARVLDFCPPGTPAEQVAALAPALRGAHTLREAADLVELVLHPPAGEPLPEFADLRRRYPERLDEPGARALLEELRRRNVPLRRLRLALTGRDRGPELWAVVAALPREEAIRRAA